MMFLTKRQSAIAAVTLLLVLSPSLALGAAGLVPIVPQDAASGCNGPGGCQSICAIAQLAQNILNDSIFVAVFLAAFLFAYAGVRMLMSPTNPGGRQKGTALLRNVLIGFVIILGAWLVINAVMGIMVGNGPGLPWNKIC